MATRPSAPPTAPPTIFGVLLELEPESELTVAFLALSQASALRAGADVESRFVLASEKILFS
jgi:hypothetical protein